MPQNPIAAAPPPISSALLKCGWNVKELAKCLGVAEITLYIAWNGKGKGRRLRRKIENITGHPFFTEPTEFQRRRESIAFYGLDIETLTKSEALALARKLRVKGSVRTSRPQIVARLLAHKAETLQLIRFQPKKPKQK